MWIIVLLAVGVVGILIVRALLKKAATTPTTVRQITRHMQSKLADATTEQRVEFSNEVRTLALDQYEMASAFAKSKGKDDKFAHQSGVYRAISAIIMNGDVGSKHNEQQILDETMPFNLTEHDVGRRAVAEYLVWKLFPEQADESIFAACLRQFRADMRKAAEEQDEPARFLTHALHSQGTDWQRWLHDNPDAKD